MCLNKQTDNFIDEHARKTSSRKSLDLLRVKLDSLVQPSDNRVKLLSQLLKICVWLELCCCFQYPAPAPAAAAVPDTSHSLSDHGKAIINHFYVMSCEIVWELKTAHFSTLRKSD